MKKSGSKSEKYCSVSIDETIFAFKSVFLDKKKEPQFSGMKLIGVRSLEDSTLLHHKPVVRDYQRIQKTLDSLPLF